MPTSAATTGTESVAARIVPAPDHTIVITVAWRGHVPRVWCAQGNGASWAPAPRAGFPLTSQSSMTVGRTGEHMIRGPLKILRIEAILRDQSRRSPAGLWITVVGLEHEPFTVIGVGLVVVGRPDIVWAHAPARWLRRRGWTVTKKHPLSICFPLHTLEVPATPSSDEQPHLDISVESVVVSLSSGIEMRQRIYHIVRETKRTRWFWPRG